MKTFLKIFLIVSTLALAVQSQAAPFGWNSFKLGLAKPYPIGSITPNTGAFTTLTASSTNSLGLGTAGSAVGQIKFYNATSGSITLAPVTGALGTPTLLLGTTFTNTKYCTYSTTTGFTCNAEGGAAGSVATDAIFDAKGDLAIGTGANTAAKKAVAADYSILYPKSAAADGTGWDWIAPVNSSILGYNSAGVLGAYTSILIDNSAAQFKDATDATKLWTVSPVNFGTGVDFTFSPYVAADLSWSPTISVAGISTGVLFVEVDGHTDSTNLTAANVSRTFINSYDRAGAATLTLPAAAAGYSFVAIVGTQHNSLWKIQRAGSDTIYWDSGGTLTAGKTYFGETNQAVGSRVSCSTFRTGAAAWSWLCGVVSGTWSTD